MGSAGAVSLITLLEHYGYVVVFVGCIVEGETPLVMAGFAAHRGYLAFDWVVIAAFCGSLLGDQAIYFVGRRYGRALVSRRAGLALGFRRVQPLIDRYGNWLLVSFRFLYGLRTVTPLAVALVGVTPRRFLCFNVIGAALWSLAVGALGYFFGNLVESLLSRARVYEEAALGTIALVGLAVAVWHRIGARWRGVRR